MDTAVMTYFFSGDASFVLGSNDKNIPYLEALMHTELIVRGSSISADPAPPYFSRFMARLEALSSRNGALDEAEIFMEYQLMFQPEADDDDKVFIQIQDKQVHPKSKMQRMFMKALKSSDVVFALGPAGTGKTFISIIWALSEVMKGHKGKILLARPVVEAGESLGFLPGDLQQKLNPYLRPLYDAMEYAISPRHVQRLEENGTIEIAPLAYMRGRSVNNAIMILDEAQNATSAQIKMFLTRLGENSQAIVAGDPGQVDLSGKEESGLVSAAALLSGIDGISMIEFTHTDAVRSRIVREILEAYTGRFN